jgi:hypothetical protein
MPNRNVINRENNPNYPTMFYKYVCEYILEIITATELINSALNCVSNGIESDSLYILSGLSGKTTDYWEIMAYYKKSLDELNLKEPNKDDAAKYLIMHYCKLLLDKKIEVKIFLLKIKQVYSKTQHEYKDKNFVGDYFGIEIFITIYYEINDMPEKYSNGKNVDKEYEINKLFNYCYVEAKKYLSLHRNFKDIKI